MGPNIKKLINVGLRQDRFTDEISILWDYLVIKIMFGIMRD